MLKWCTENISFDNREWNYQIIAASLGVIWICGVLYIPPIKSSYTVWPSSVLQMSCTANVQAHVCTVEQVWISMRPTWDNLCSLLTIWLLEDGGAQRVFESMDVSVRCVCIHPGPWEGGRWGGWHLKVTWGREKAGAIRMAMSNMSPVTHLLLLTTKLF